MTLYEPVMLENNRACTLLHTGDFLSAQQGLDRGLHALKGYLIHCRNENLVQRQHISWMDVQKIPFEPNTMEPEDKTMLDAVNNSSSQQDYKDITRQSIESTHVRLRGKESLVVHDDSSSFAIYNRAFLLPKDDYAEREFYLEDYENWITSILIYNTGLVHYNIGVANRMNSCDLQRSLRFFEIAIELQEMIRTPPNFDMLLLQAAIVNNMGHIYMCLQSREGAKICYDMLAILFHMLQSMPQLEDNDYHLFFMNIGIEVDSLIAAPAA